MLSMSTMHSHLFLSTPSARRATGFPDRSGSQPRYFYPRPPRGGRQDLIEPEAVERKISIHALREEGDKTTTSQGPRRSRISIHALREEGDSRRSWRSSKGRNFYPRPPRGGRRPDRAGGRGTKDFYPRPPRGGRRGDRFLLRHIAGISIHALREEGDVPAAAVQLVPVCISIHALREEGDRVRSSQHRAAPNFYPRPPRGGRQLTSCCFSGS